MQVGQGDNVIIVAKIPKLYPHMSDEDYIIQFQDNLQTDCRKYMTNLKRISEGLGIIIKLEETWFSTVLLNYGKEIFFKGAYMTGILKKIGRMFQDTNDAYPSISNRVSSICTTMHASTLKGFDPFIPHLISCMEITLLLKREYRFSLNLGSAIREMMYRNNQNMSPDFLSFLLLLPSNFGGLPIMSPLKLLYRGHPDPLTSELVWMKYLDSLKFSKHTRCIMIWITLRRGIANQINYKLLVQDPLSINWARPQQAVNILKETLENALSPRKNL